MLDEKSIHFMPLGGGQTVGASCYFLKIGKESFLLDCGTGKYKTYTINPSFIELEKSGLIQSKAEIKHIFISHAHIDHIGYIPNLMSEIPNASFYMTEATREFARFQLYDKNFANKDCTKFVSEKLAVQTMFDRIKIVSFFDEFSIGDIKIKIFQAGHIPGAMMVLFSWKGKNILYTGDYSTNRTPLTDGYFLPIDLKIDYLITCALHAKNDSCKKYRSGLDTVLWKVKKILSNGGSSAYCVVNQISKGVEYLKALNDEIENGYMKKIPIYIDSSVYQIVKHMENLSLPLIKDNVHPLDEDNCEFPNIIISSNIKNHLNSCYEQMPIDFSIHDDFEETVSFIKNINPKKAVLVHCAEETVNDSGDTVEQVLFMDVECTTHFIFAENEEIYKIN